MMTEDEQFIAIAEYMGWVDIRRQVLWEGKLEDNRGGSFCGCWPATNWRCKLFDYLTDLNAIFTVESKFWSDQEKFSEYCSKLEEVVHPNIEDVRAIPVIGYTEYVVRATAKQKTEAICRMLFPERWL